MLHLAFEDIRRPGAGGGAVRTHEINRRLSAAFDIMAVCATYPGARPRREDGVDYRFIGTARLGRLVSLLSYFLCIPWALWAFDSDLVVEDFAAPFSSVAVPRLTRRPVIGVVQWLFAVEKAREYRLPFHWVERVGVRSHRTLIAVSEGMRQELLRRVPAANVTVIRNGLALPDRPPEALPRQDILFIGRLDIAHKGLDLLLDAYASVADQVGQDLVIAGDGPDEQRLRAEVDRRGLGRRVHLVGRIPTQRRLAIMAGADLVVMPSRYESFGMVAAEAMAMETPVVAFDIPCLRELVAAETGLLVPAFDVGELAAAIRDLAGDETLRRRLGAAGPAAVADLSWDRLASAQARVYDEVLSGGSPDE